GKVGVPDAILQKRNHLDDAEYEIMKSHVLIGADFFKNPQAEWDTLAYEITLNHHEKWDGTGYPGQVSDPHMKYTQGEGKKGYAIPLSARIVAIADVYDALISKRIYKDPWEEQKVLHHIRQQSG